MSDDLATTVVNWCIALGVAFAAIGMLMLVVDWHATLRVRKAAIKAASDAEGVAPSGELAGDSQAPGAIASSVKAVAELASALKDLEGGSGLLVLALAFFAIAAVAAGADAVAGAVSTP